MKILIVLLGILSGIAIALLPVFKHEADENEYAKLKKFTTIIIVLFLFSVLAPFTIVSPGHRGVIVQLGAVKPNVLSEGIHFRVPIIQKIEQLDCRIQKEEVKAGAASKDLQQVTSKIAINYRVDGNMAAKLYRNVGFTYPQTIIAPAIQESMKSVTARYTAEELITKRQDVSVEVKNKLDSKIEQYGIIVDNFNIVNFDFSDEFNKAIESKQTAEQLALKAKRDLERVKIEAEQQITSAKAEAESLKVQKQEVTPELIKLREIEMQREAIKRWDGKLPTYTGDGVPFIQVK